MNEKYFIGRSKKQIENINELLIEKRNLKKEIEEDIENLVCVKDLLKEGVKLTNK